MPDKKTVEPPEYVDGFSDSMNPAWLAVPDYFSAFVLKNYMFHLTMVQKFKTQYMA